MHSLPQLGLNDFYFGGGIDLLQLDSLAAPVASTYIELARELPSLLDCIPLDDAGKSADIVLAENLSAPVFGALDAPALAEGFDFFQDGLDSLIGCGVPPAVAAPLPHAVFFDDASLVAAAAAAAAVPAISVPSTPLHFPPPAPESRPETPTVAPNGMTLEYVRGLSNAEYMSLKKRTPKDLLPVLQHLRGRENNTLNCRKSRARAKQRQTEMQQRTEALELEVQHLRPLKSENQRLKAEINALRRQVALLTGCRSEMPM